MTKKCQYFIDVLTNKTWNVFQLENEYGSDKHTNLPFKTEDKHRESSREQHSSAMIS